MRRTLTLLTVMVAGATAMVMGAQPEGPPYTLEQLEDDLYICLLYTSDAADE